MPEEVPTEVKRAEGNRAWLGTPEIHSRQTLDPEPVPTSLTLKPWTQNPHREPWEAADLEVWTWQKARLDEACEHHEQAAASSVDQGPLRAPLRVPLRVPMRVALRVPLTLTGFLQGLAGRVFGFGFRLPTALE